MQSWARTRQKIASDVTEYFGFEDEHPRKCGWVTLHGRDDRVKRPQKLVSCNHRSRAPVTLRET